MCLGLGNTIPLDRDRSPLEPPEPFIIEGQGDYSGVAILNIEVNEETTISIVGPARFYDDEACTQSPNTSRELSSGGIVSLYIKTTEGKSVLTIKDPEKVKRLGLVDYENGWASYTPFFVSADENSPFLTADVSGYPNLEDIALYDWNPTLNVFIRYNTPSLSRKLKYFDLYCNGLATGDVSDLPRGLKYFNQLTDSIMTGNLRALPPDIEYFIAIPWYGYSNWRMYGALSELPLGLTVFAVGDMINVYGDIKDFNRNSKYLIIGSNACTCFGDIADLPEAMNVFSWYSSAAITYRGGREWADDIYYIKIKPAGPGLSLSEMIELIVDLGAADWSYGSSSYFYIKGTCASMNDTSQGGIWGDFSDGAAPSDVAVALKKIGHICGTPISLIGVTVPGATGDGAGFPAGFGDWWRT